MVFSTVFIIHRVPMLPIVVNNVVWLLHGIDRLKLDISMDISLFPLPSNQCLSPPSPKEEKR